VSGRSNQICSCFGSFVVIEQEHTYDDDKSDEYVDRLRLFRATPLNNFRLFLLHGRVE